MVWYERKGRGAAAAGWVWRLLQFAVGLGVGM